MSTDLLRIATRKSPLALWQAEHVRDRLLALYPGLQVELVTLSTQGDRILDSPLAKIGGKGLFVKELEQGMLNGSADIAVHSMKDVPAAFPEGLGLGAVLEREDPRDAFVSNEYASIDDLPEAARVGTSSLRRQCQLRDRRPDLQISDLRGNVGTRLGKLDNGGYDAIVLACAGLKRLGMEARITRALAPEEMLPAIAQGVIGIECRLDDARVRGLLEPLNHPETVCRTQAERDTPFRTYYTKQNHPWDAVLEDVYPVQSMKRVVKEYGDTTFPTVEPVYQIRYKYRPAVCFNGP